MMSPMHQIFGQWLQSLKQYLLMCLLLSSPERLPYNPWCIALTILGYFVIGLFLVDAKTAYVFIAAQIVLQLAMLALIAWVGLRMKKNQWRFQQTFSALAGVSMVIDACAVPLHRAMTATGGEPTTQMQLLGWAIVFWNLAVISLILKRALEVPTHISAIIAFNYFVIYQFIVFGLFQ